METIPLPFLWLSATCIVIVDTFTIKNFHSVHPVRTTLLHTAVHETRSSVRFCRITECQQLEVSASSELD